MKGGESAERRDKLFSGSVYRSINKYHPICLQHNLQKQVHMFQAPKHTIFDERNWRLGTENAENTDARKQGRPCNAAAARWAAQVSSPEIRSRGEINVQKWEQVSLFDAPQERREAATAQVKGCRNCVHASILPRARALGAGVWVHGYCFKRPGSKYAIYAPGDECKEWKGIEG